MCSPPQKAQIFAMVRHDGYFSGKGWHLLPLASFLVGLTVGCGGALTPEQMKAMSTLQELGARIDLQAGGYEVNLSRTAVQDRDLVHLQHIPKLKKLSLQETQITDAGLAHLEPIQTLEFIALSRTTVTDKGMEKLKLALPNARVQN